MMDPFAPKFYSLGQNNFFGNFGLIKYRAKFLPPATKFGQGYVSFRGGGGVPPSQVGCLLPGVPPSWGVVSQHALRQTPFWDVSPSRGCLLLGIASLWGVVSQHALRQTPFQGGVSFRGGCASFRGVPPSRGGCLPPGGWYPSMH